MVRLGGLVATVPNSAASLYKSKALLHWSSVQLNGGATFAGEGDDAVEVDAYFGDAERRRHPERRRRLGHFGVATG